MDERLKGFLLSENAVNPGQRSLEEGNHRRIAHALRELSERCGRVGTEAVLYARKLCGEVMHPHEGEEAEASALGDNHPRRVGDVAQTPTDSQRSDDERDHSDKDSTQISESERASSRNLSELSRQMRINEPTDANLRIDHEINELTRLF